jgi:hypothetical protein
MQVQPFEYVRLVSHAMARWRRHPSLLQETASFGMLELGQEDVLFKDERRCSV